VGGDDHRVADAAPGHFDGALSPGQLSLDRFEARLTRQFSVMEQLIAQMNDQSSQFASMLVMTPQAPQG